MVMNKYQPFSEFLTNLSKDQIVLSFGEIEEILDFPLPESAATHRQWWENSQTHVQAQGGWLPCGWRVSSVNLSDKVVTFQRNKTPIYPAKMRTLSGARKFEELAQKEMSAYFGKALRQRKKQGWGKTFDLVSDDFRIVGDAKYYTMVDGKSLPPAKFSIIAEHVWLLEKTGAPKKFLVFGNDKRVPQLWLKKYGTLVNSVKFFFVTEDGNVEQMN
jgi:hypothetical protein